MTINKKELKNFLELPGISGNESLVSDKLKEIIVNNKLELKRDNLGSIWGYKKSKNPNAQTLMIDAHMDEIGFVVLGITKTGFIKFQEQGGIWPTSLTLQRLRVYSLDLKDSFSGVVCFSNDFNPHSSKGKVPKIEGMLLDIGADSDKEVKDWGIGIGSIMTFDTKVEFNGNRVIGKSADNRAGVYIISELMKYISNKVFDFHIAIGASVQEEVGLRGAKTSTFLFNPDLAFVIDISQSNDIPKNKNEGSIGFGTMLRHKDALAVYPKRTTSYIKKILELNKIKYQDYFSQGGTNAGIIHISNSGIPVLPFGFLARNLHTGSSVFDLSDLEDTLKLLVKILDDLDYSKIKKLII